MKNGRSANEKASIGERARGVAVQAIPQARRAGTTAVHGVKQGVEGARGWAAPRLDSAADALSATVAPKVSSVMHSAARTVKPAQTGKSGIRRLLSWRWLTGLVAAMAAAGAAAAVTLRRYQNATSDARNGADALTDEATGANSADEAAKQQVNGQVTTSGR